MLPVEAPRSRGPTGNGACFLESSQSSTRVFLGRSGFAIAFAAFLSAPAFADDVPVFKLTVRNGAFEPAVIEVPAGKRLRLEITNEDKAPIEFESRPLKQEKIIAAGAKATITINAMKAGEYKFFDEFHEKTAQGKLVAR